MNNHTNWLTILIYIRLFYKQVEWLICWCCRSWNWRNLSLTQSLSRRSTKPLTSCFRGSLSGALSPWVLKTLGRLCSDGKRAFLSGVMGTFNKRFCSVVYDLCTERTSSLWINEISHMFPFALFNNVFQFVSYYGNLYVFFCDCEACFCKCIHWASPFRLIPYSSRTRSS
jgi:hypothetical protein